VRWSAHFSVDKAIDSYLAIYGNILNLTCGGHGVALPFNERAKA
jgi:hypothetical protein